MVITRSIFFSIISFFLIYCTFTSNVSAHSWHAHTKDHTTKIVTSIRPLALLVQQLAMPDDEVILLIDSNRSPHHYQLKVSDRTHLGTADLVVWVGPELEAFLEKPLSQRKHGVLTISDLDQLTWPDMENAPADPHGHNHHRDPHVWLDPHNVKAVAKVITRKLTQRRPQHTDMYQKNYKAVEKEAVSLDASLKKSLPPVADKPFIVLHPAYNHFVRRYGLNQLGHILLTPERGIGAKHLYQLRKSSPVCIFGEEGQDAKFIHQLVDSTGANSAMIDPLGLNLPNTALALDVIHSLAETLTTCLSTQ